MYVVQSCQPSEANRASLRRCSRWRRRVAVCSPSYYRQRRSQAAAGAFRSFVDATNSSDGAAAAEDEQADDTGRRILFWRASPRAGGDWYQSPIELQRTLRAHVGRGSDTTRVPGDANGSVAMCRHGASSALLSPWMRVFCVKASKLISMKRPQSHRR